jgi:O-antigen/teichoic acid export membrane protein
MKWIIILLIFTAVVVPYISYNFDEPLTADQWQVLTLCLCIATAMGTIVFVVSAVTDNYS